MSAERFEVPLHAADGDTVTCPIYVGETVEGVHPLEQQAAWYRRERGLAVPHEVMDSFRRLAEIALENKVSFSELCVYSMGEASKEQATADGGGT